MKCDHGELVYCKSLLRHRFSDPDFLGACCPGKVGVQLYAAPIVGGLWYSHFQSVLVRGIPRSETSSLRASMSPVPAGPGGAPAI